MTGSVEPSLLTCFSEQSKAFVITSVNAPNLQRPSDGILYPFNITVSGLYDRLDEVASGIKDSHDAKAEYWDKDVFFDDPIDLNGVLTIPLIGARRGNPWGPVNVTFKVGCTTGSKVFDPSGNTGENPMDDGYFRFESYAGGFSEWGYNTVTCLSTTTPPVPINPPPPYPPLKNIPEPTSTLSLLALGTLGAASTLKRQLKPSKSTEKETTKVG
jgi:hypothetical protein